MKFVLLILYSAQNKRIILVFWHKYNALFIKAAVWFNAGINAKFISLGNFKEWEFLEDYTPRES